MWLHRPRLTYWLLPVAFLISCERADPLQPAVQATAAAGSGSTLAAPSGTNAVAASESQIDVAWQDNSSAETGFEVHRSTTGPAGTFTLWVSTGAGVTSFSDAGLTHSTQYCYRVRAFRATGRKASYSTFSSTACTTTPVPPPPATPSPADAIPAHSTAVYVNWVDNSTNEDGFRIERSTDGGVSWATAGTVGPNGSSHNDGGRASEMPVCYRVVAFNSGGDSPPSNTDCTTPPAGPTNLTLTSDPLTNEFEFTWTDNSTVEGGYEVWICMTIDGSELCGWFDRLPANSTSYRLWWDYRDRFFVMATKDGGYSDASNVVTIP